MRTTTRVQRATCNTRYTATSHGDCGGLTPLLRAAWQRAWPCRCPPRSARSALVSSRERNATQAAKDKTAKRTLRYRSPKPSRTAACAYTKGAAAPLAGRAAGQRESPWRLHVMRCLCATLNVVRCPRVPSQVPAQDQVRRGQRTPVGVVHHAEGAKARKARRARALLRALSLLRWKSVMLAR